MSFGKISVKNKLVRASIQRQRNNPFFAYLSLYLKFHEEKSKDIPTMGVDIGGNVYYNEEWVDKLSDEELQGVIVHEICHLAFMHLTRRGAREAELFNIASDIAVNNILKNNGYSLPAGGLIPYGNSIDLGSGIKVEDIEKKNAEQIYEELEKKLKKLGNKIISQLRKKGFDIHIEGREGQGNQNKKDGKGSGSGGFNIRLPLTDAEKRQIEKEWLQKAQDAATSARMRGNLPAGMELLLGKLHEAKVNWKTLLNQYIQSQIPMDFTYSRPNKKSISMGVYTPDYVRERIKVLVAVDTSGSIGEKERIDFVSEIVGIAKSYKDRVEMIFLTHDTEVQNDYLMENGNIAKIQKLKLNGGGGTSHKPVMDYIEKKHRDCKVCVFLTDGYSDLNEFDMSHYRFGKMFVISEGGSSEQLKNKPCKVIELEKYKY